MNDELKNIEQLYGYGKELFDLEEYDKAYLCFQKCFELDSNLIDSLYYMFLISLSQKDYEKSFKNIDTLLRSNNIFYKIDANFYLYVLSIITTIPKKYQKYVRGLKIYDLIVPFNDNRYNESDLQNKIRIEIQHRKFSYALVLLKKIINKNNIISIQDIIIKELLNQALNEENIIKKRINDFLKEKDYKGIIDCLNDKQRKHKLHVIEIYVLKLAIRINKIMKTGIVPKPDFNNADNIFAAIDSENYFLAKVLNKEYNEQKNCLNAEDNALTILLNDICDLIINLESKEENKLLYNETIKYYKNLKITIMLNDIIINFKKNDLVNALLLIKNYLQEIGKSEFEFLVLDLIKISLLEKDIYFSKVIDFLTLVGNDNYSLNITDYIKDFYKNVLLEQEKFMINESINPLLINFEEIINTANNIANLKEILVESHEKLMEQKGIILLKPLDLQCIEQILKLVQYYHDITAFKIGDEENEQIVLRYTPKITYYVDVKNLLNKANQEFHDGLYNDSIKHYLEILEFIYEPRSYIYSQIGLLYLKLFNPKQAIDYLIVATELAKKENLNYDYSDLILRLKKEITK